jgi:transposase, IS30 family
MARGQLTLDERYQISSMLQQRKSRAEIARCIDRDRSTITRELERNSIVRVQDGQRIVYYDPKQAQFRAHERRVVKGAATRKIQDALRELVDGKLQLGWSPQQISARLRAEGLAAVSHETIYQHVIRNSHEHRGWLRHTLRFSGYKHRRLRKSKHAQRTRALRKHIDGRPAAANERSELGHWERDCVVSGKHGRKALLTIVDRKSRFACIALVEHNVDAVASATVAALAEHADVTKTITNDNGSEFHRSSDLEDALGLPVYFCDPSSPWQRGSVENLNGLVRQYVPKGMNLDELPAWFPAALADTLNHRPRKVLGWKTPFEVWTGQSVKLMSGPLLRVGLEFTSAT